MTTSLKKAVALGALTAIAALCAATGPALAQRQNRPGCEAGSACIVPITSPNERAVTTQSTDVVVNPITIQQVQNRSTTAPVECRTAGASECIRPQGGTYTVYPYPFASLSAMQPGFGLDVLTSWTTSNAISEALLCAGPSGIQSNAAIPANGTNYGLAGSGTWPSGLYTCTITAQNAFGRIVTAMAQVLVRSVNAAPPPVPFPVPIGIPNDDVYGGCVVWTSWDPTTFTWFYQVAEPSPGLSRSYAEFANVRYSWNTTTGQWDQVLATVTRARIWPGRVQCA